MKLDYIYHSGFAIEADEVTVLIDYWKDSSDEPGQGLVRDHLLERPGALYVLSSHSTRTTSTPKCSAGATSGLTSATSSPKTS